MNNLLSQNDDKITMQYLILDLVGTVENPMFYLRLLVHLDPITLY